MRISELIKRLENVRSEHGDLYVLIGQLRARAMTIWLI